VLLEEGGEDGGECRWGCCLEGGEASFFVCAGEVAEFGAEVKGCYKVEDDVVDHLEFLVLEEGWGERTECGE
jgi:hypothetical protein